MALSTAETGGLLVKRRYWGEEMTKLLEMIGFGQG
jgi:hypothetical protein